MSYRTKLLLAVSTMALSNLSGIPSARAEVPADVNPLQEIVVTGTANPAGQRKQDAGYAITTATEDAIRDAAPISAADLTKLVPGMFAETTGGVAGPNVEVRGFPTAGDAPWVSMQLNGLPIFPVATLSFMDNSTQYRLDDSVDRMEATIGGPAVLWGSAQPGATMNFLEKNGQTNAEGELRFTVGSGDLYRTDGYYGGKIADGWYGSIGGFYRTDSAIGGVRDTQFPAEQGYQLEATLVHDIDDGKITVYGRTTDDHDQFFTPIPLISSGSGSSPSLSGFPGFNPLTATFIGNANRYVTFDTGLNQSMTVDLQKGRGIDNRLFGFDLDKHFGNYTFTNKMSYLSEETFCVCQFTGTNPQTLGSFIADSVTSANGTSAVTAAAGLATGGTANFAGSGQAITNLNQQVIGIGVWYVDKQVTAFQDEARISRPLTETNTLTLGTYFADYTSHDIWYLGNNQLMTVQNNAQPITVQLNNGVKVTNNNGIFSPNSYDVNNSYSARNEAGIVEDDWKVTDQLKLDAGLRMEFQQINWTAEQTGTQDDSSNPLNLYDYGAAYVTGASIGEPTSSKEANAFTIGADYAIASNLNGFVRYNQGYALPNFDDLRSGVEKTTHVKQAQGGIKTATDLYALYVTGFYSDFTGQPTSVILANGQQINYLTDSRTEGVEVEANVRPITNLELAVTGDYQHGTYTAGTDPDGASFAGNTVIRQPTVQMHFTPSYKIPTAFGLFRVYATTTYVGQRWADVDNTQALPAYVTEDIGASLALENGIDIQFTGTNITNTLAITEGNTRVLGSGVGTGGVFLGRPLFGAAYQASVALHF